MKQKNKRTPKKQFFYFYVQALAPAVCNTNANAWVSIEKPYNDKEKQKTFSNNFRSGSNQVLTSGSNTSA